MTSTLPPDAPFTTQTALEVGTSRFALRRLVTEGRLRPLLRGVYVDSSVPDTAELRCQAVGLIVTPHHVVTDRTAAYLHGVDVFTFVEAGGVPRVEVSVLRGHRETKRGEVASGSRTLLDRDVMSLGGITLTTPLRTALDLGCRLRRRDAFAAMNALATLHGFGVEEMVRELPRYRGRRGVVQVRELIPRLEPRLESMREAWVWNELHDAGFEIPVPQYWIDVDGVPTYRLDFAYPRRRVALEYNGEEHHSSAEDRRHDEERRTWLREHGWRLVEVERGDFTGDRLDAWLRQLRDALSETPTNLRW